MSSSLPELLLRSQSDERLAALARQGHERAFTTLVERHRGQLVAAARAAAGPDYAEDVVQQALMDAWSSLRRGTEVEHVRGWLHQIVRRASWRAIDGRSHHGELPLQIAAGGSPADTVADQLQLRRVVEDVVALPANQRVALVQTAFEGRSRTEIAASLGISEGAVRQLVHRAREQLRRAAAAIIPLPLLRRVVPHHGSGGAARNVSELLRNGTASAGPAAAIKITAAVLVTGAIAAGGTLHHGRAPAHAVASTQSHARGTAPASARVFAAHTAEQPVAHAARSSGHRLAHPHQVDAPATRKSQGTNPGSSGGGSPSAPGTAAPTPGTTGRGSPTQPRSTDHGDDPGSPQQESSSSPGDGSPGSADGPSGGDGPPGSYTSGDSSGSSGADGTASDGSNPASDPGESDASSSQDGSTGG